MSGSETWLNLKDVTTISKLGNRLTRRPCKGDEFEIVIFEGKRENDSICRSRQKVCTTWTFISIGRRVTQEWKFEFRLRGDSIFLFKGEKKTLEFCDFESSKSHQSRRYSILFRTFAAVTCFSIRSHCVTPVYFCYLPLCREDRKILLIPIGYDKA